MFGVVPRRSNDTLPLAYLTLIPAWPRVLGVPCVGYDYKTMRITFEELFYKLHIKRKFTLIILLFYLVLTQARVDEKKCLW